MRYLIAILLTCLTLQAATPTPSLVGGIRVSTDTTGTNTIAANVVVTNLNGGASRTGITLRDLQVTNAIKMLGLTANTPAYIGSDKTITNGSGGFSASFDTVADMVQAVVTPITTSALVNRRSTLVSDGVGGGQFYYDSSSATATNGGTVFAPASGTGRWFRVWSDYVSADWFGARGNGSADDTVALQEPLTLGLPLMLPPKTYKITSALSLTSQGQVITGSDPIQSVLFQTTAHASGIINGLGAGNVIGQVKLRNFTIRATDLAVTYAALDLTNVNDATIDGIYITRNDNSLSNTNGWDRPLILNTCWKSTFQNGLINGRPGCIAVNTDGYAGSGSGANSCKLMFTQVNAPGGIGVLLTNCNNFCIIGCVFEGTTTNAIDVTTAGGFDNNNEHWIAGNRFELDSIGYTPIRLESGSSRNHVMANLYGSGGASNTNNIINLGTDNEILEGNYKENNLVLKQLEIIRQAGVSAPTQDMGIGFSKGTQNFSTDDLYIGFFNGPIDSTRSNLFAKIEGRTAGSTGYLYLYGEVQTSSNLYLTNITANFAVGTDTPRDPVDFANRRVSMTESYALVWRKANTNDSYGAINSFRATDTNSYTILESMNNGVLTEGLRVNTNAYVEVPVQLVLPAQTASKIAVLDANKHVVAGTVSEDSLVHGASNQGSGIGVFANETTPTNLVFNSLLGAHGITVSSNAGTLTIDLTRTNYIGLELGNPNSAVVTGSTNFWIAPEAATLKTVTAHLFVTSSSGSVTMDLKKNGTTVLSAPVSIAAGSTNATATVSVSSITALDRLAGEVTAAGTTAYGAYLTFGVTTP